eukprot:gene14228-19091_t
MVQLAPNIDIVGGIVGGVIIGISASIYLYTTGKITGVSGITRGTFGLNPNNEDKTFNWSYFAGLFSAGLIFATVLPKQFGAYDQIDFAALILGGILTGFGTSLGNGCTSGHGLCGISRRSPRSITAACTFVGVAAISAYMCRRQFILRPLFYSNNTAYLSNENTFDSFKEVILSWLPTIVLLFVSYILFRVELRLLGQKQPNLPKENQKETEIESDTSSERNSSLNVSYDLSIKISVESSQSRASSSESTTKISSRPFDSTQIKTHGITYLCALVFGIGLVYSGMCDPERRVMMFLDFSGGKGWDPTLMFMITFITFHLFKKYDPPVLLDKSKTVGSSLKMGFVQENMKIDSRLLIGASLFGIGWGMCGVCPGPGIVSLGATKRFAAVFMPSLIFGMVIFESLVYKKYL